MRCSIAGIAGIAALALTLAACGGGTSEDADTSNDQAAADPTAVEGELTWWDTGPDERGSCLQGADQEVQRGVPERQDQLRVGPLR